MKIEIYREKCDEVSTKYFWVYKDFSNPETKSSQNTFYQIRYQGQKAIRQIEEWAVHYGYIKRSMLHTRIDFETLSADVQEIILKDYPELGGRDEFEKFCDQYQIS